MHQFDDKQLQTLVDLCGSVNLAPIFVRFASIFAAAHVSHTTKLCCFVVVVIVDNVFIVVVVVVDDDDVVVCCCKTLSQRYTILS